ncbi:MAG: mycothiol synthase [Acidimicrobiales bacterium]
MGGPVLEVRDRLAAADRDAVVALVDAATAADGFRPIADREWLELTGPVPDAATDAATNAATDAGAGQAVTLLAREGDDGRLAGYARLSRHRGTWVLSAVVHPDRRQGGAYLELLLGGALSEVGARGGGPVRRWVFRESPGAETADRRSGFAVERELFQMGVDLPLPEGGPTVPVRPFEPGRDEEAWLAVNNRAFASHPDQGGWEVADVLRREAEPWFDPAGFLLHEVEGRIAAFCWTRVHDETRPVTGEIYVIGVTPDFQGNGLGRAMTVAGLDHLARSGIGAGILYVDADNGPALRLYRSLGFVVDRVDRAYLRQVAPGGARHRTGPQKPEMPTTRPTP